MPPHPVPAAKHARVFYARPERGGSAAEVGARGAVPLPRADAHRWQGARDGA